MIAVQSYLSSAQSKGTAARTQNEKKKSIEFDQKLM